jgi:hypothetical protein
MMALVNVILVKDMLGQWSNELVFTQTTACFDMWGLGSLLGVFWSDLVI